VEIPGGNPPALQGALFAGVGHAMDLRCGLLTIRPIGYAGLQRTAEVAMRTLTDDELKRHPSLMMEDARRGEAALVAVDGQVVMMTVPLGKGLASPAVRIELAARLFESEQLSLGLAARIAGLSYRDMVDELARRSIPVVRYAPEDVAGELDYLRRTAGP
jgi:predicted HTH domain antitoxin